MASDVRDVFISYSSHDQAIAFAVCHVLEEHKIRCWIAPRDIPLGEWGQIIIAAIQRSRLMVVVLSGHSNASRFVMKEVERAVHYTVHVIPFRVENVEPTGSLEFLLAGEHWLDAMTPPLEQHLEELARRVQHVLAGETDSQRFLRRARKLRLRPAELAALVTVLALACMPVTADFVLRLNVAPPWPYRLAVDLFTGMVNAVAVVSLLIVWRSLDARALAKQLARLAAATAILFVVYVILMAQFVRNAPTVTDQDVIGFILLPEVKELMAQDRSLTVEELLIGAGDEPMKVWVGWTVVIARVCLLTAWLAFYVSFSALATVLVRLAQARPEPLLPRDG
jgi:hypothetical protein